MWQIGCVRCKKSRRDFVAHIFALIAPVHPMHRVSWSYEMIPNAPKQYATHQSMSSGSNGVDWVLHCEKSRCDFVARTFVLIAPVQYILHQLICTYETFPNAPKYNKTHRNISLGSNGVDWVHLLLKNPNVTLWHELLH